MTIRNCPECGRLFQGLPGQVCALCMEEMDKDLRKVRDYLDDHSGASVEEVSRATGLRADRITGLIKKGHVVASATALGPTCQSCGTAIPGGRYCPRCIARLEGEIKQAVREAAPDPRMLHTRNNTGSRR